MVATSEHALFHHINIEITFLSTKLACVGIFLVKTNLLLKTDFLVPVLHVSK